VDRQSRGLENCVTRTVLTRLPKVFFTNLHEIREPNVGRFTAHLFEDILSIGDRNNGINNGTISQAISTLMSNSTAEVSP
jgi:hypothetical protein